MRLFDISVTVQPGMPTWPGDTLPQIRRTSSIKAGDDANVSEVRMSVHTGTHVDAPVHFLDGARGVERIPVEALYGSCVVAQKLGPGHITAEDVERMRLLEGIERVLFKTPNSRLWERSDQSFESGYAALTEDAARYLLSRRVVLVGIDYLSIEPFEVPGRPVHRLLLSEGVVIVEGLDLRGVEPGEYTLACLPIKVAGADGSPARALLIRE